MPWLPASLTPHPDSTRFDSLAHVHIFRSRFARFLDGLGLTLSLRHDIETWADHIRTAPDAQIVSPTFDPSIASLTPDNFFWICVSDRAGKIAACGLNRLYPDADVRQLLESWELWYDDGRPTEPKMTLEFPDDMPPLRGSLAFGGALWCHPDWRQIKLGQQIGHLTRLHALVDWNIDIQFALFKRTLIQRFNSPARSPHFATYTIVPCCSGYFPPYDKNMEVDLGYMTASQLRALAQSSADVVFPLHAN